MKKTIFFLFVVCTVASCQHHLYTWQVGEVSNEVAKTFQSAQKTQLKLIFESQSYCIMAHGIELKVYANGSLVDDQVIYSLPATKTISIPKNAPIEVKTKSIPLSNGNTCKRLGNVLCKLYY